MSWLNLDLAARHKTFVDIAERMDEVIIDRANNIVTPFNKLIPRGTFQHGEGVLRQAFVHIPGVSPLKGLVNWKAVLKAREGTPPYDPCTVSPEIVEHGYKKIQYTLYSYSQATEPLCVNDITTTWHFEEQARLMVNWLADVTIQTWDTAFRHMYMKMASDANSFYVMAGGIPQDTVTYDPFVADADGDLTIEIPKALFDNLSLLDWKALNYIRRKLQLTARSGSVANDGGEPLFGLICDADDVDDAIARSKDLRERYLYAEPSILVDDFGKVRRIPGYVIMEDVMIPRLVVKRETANKVVLKLVYPFEQVAHSGMVVGKDVRVNQEYLDAPIALAHILVKNVFQADIRQETPRSLGGKMVFGPAPGYNGVFKWINNPDMTVNYLGDKGFFLALYAFAPRVLENYDKAVCLIYRRCVQNPPVRCESYGEDAVTQANITSWVAVAGSNTLFDATVDGWLKAEVGDAAHVVVGSNTYVCTIANVSRAPTYRLSFLPANVPTGTPSVLKVGLP